jgi:hypothetical protein
MRAGTVLGIAFILVCPALSCLLTPGSAVQGRSPEEGTIDLSDFSAMSMANLTLRFDGGVSLKKSGDYVGLPEITVTTAPAIQNSPIIAMFPNDTSIVVWANYTATLGYNHIFGQRLDADLQKIAEEICVFRGGCNERPDVAINPDEDMLLVSDNYPNGGSINSIRLDSEGAQLGGSIGISNQNFNSNAKVAACQDRYLVVWQGKKGSWTGEFDIFGQYIDFNGTRIGQNFIIAGGGAQQECPDVASDGKEAFVVVWVERDQHNGILYAKGFSSTGSETTGRITVDSQNYYKSFPAIEITNNGTWAIVWSQHSDQTDAPALHIRIFDKNGNPKWGPKVVSGAMDGAPRPGIIWAPWNEYVTYYADFRGSPSDQGSLWARRLDPAGNPLGQEMPVSVKPNTEHGTSLAASEDGALYFTWSDETTTDIHARKFIRPYLSQGILVTGDISVPADFGQWSNLSAGIVLQNATGNRVIIEYTSDSGKTWSDVADNGSIAGARSASPIRLRIKFQTLDNRTTPILYNLTIRYQKGSGPHVNHRPMVFTGPDIEAFKNTTVVLTATGSDEDGDSLSFTWIQTKGENAILGGQGTDSASFVPARSGVFGFQVIADDGFLQSAPAFMNVTVLNRVPTIIPCMEILTWNGNDVQLNATCYDPDGDDLVVVWSQTAGNHTYFESFNGTKPVFYASVSGRFTFRAVAFDGESQSAPMFVNVTIYDNPNGGGGQRQQPWLSVPGDITCYRRTLVQLNCTGNASGGLPVSFTWTQVGGEAQALNEPLTGSPWFLANRSGTFRFRVTVTDGFLTSLPKYINVTVLNRIPAVAVNGSITCHEGDTVVLRVAGSDPDGDPVALAWTQVAGDHRYFEKRTGAETSFKAIQPGRYRFRVVANDGEADSPAAEIEVRVLAGTKDLDVAEYPFWVLFLVLAVIIAFIVIMIRQRMLAKKY